MNQIKFKIEDFEGPLDLLLVLISKNKMSIADVEIITIINQYLQIINSTDEKDLDSASEFIDMAARLVYLKSVYLLPKDDKGEKLKAELQGQLTEYSMAKKAAEKLRNRFVGDKIIFRPAQYIEEDNTYNLVHSKKTIVTAYERLSTKGLAKKPPETKIFETIVNKPVVSVNVKIYSVLKGIIKNKVTTIYSAFNDMKSKSEAVATFLAVLELMRAKRIELSDDGAFTLKRREKR